MGLQLTAADAVAANVSTGAVAVVDALRQQAPRAQVQSFHYLCLCCCSYLCLRCVSLCQMLLLLLLPNWLLL